MLGKRLFTLTRKFCTGIPPKRILNMHLVYAGCVCTFLLGFRQYLKNLDDPMVKEERTSKISDFSENNTNYHGVSRRSEAEVLLEKLKKNSILVFAPVSAGKTNFLKYLSSVCNPSILLEIQPNIIDTFNYFNFEHQLHENNLNEFLGAIESALKKSQNPLLIIDGFEKLSDIHQKRFLIIFKMWVETKICQLIISTNHSETANFLINSGIENFELPSLAPNDFLMACKGISGCSSVDAEIILEKCGPDLGYIIEMTGNKELALELLKRKKEEIVAWVKANDNKFTREKVQYFLNTINEKRPLGDVFIANKVAKQLAEAKVLDVYPKASGRFRNFYVISVLKECFNS